MEHAKSLPTAATELFAPRRTSVRLAERAMGEGELVMENLWWESLVREGWKPIPRMYC